MRTPASSLPLAEAFWSRVWRCTHRHPCNKCCWPWLQPDGLYDFVADHAQFAHPALPYSPMPAHRVADLLTHGTPLLPIPRLHACHLCHFPPCCNPSHHRPGSATDNMRGTGGRPQWKRPAVCLPDGRLLTFARRHLQGPSRPMAPRRSSQYRQPIFCLYANTYDGLRGYPLTDTLCQVVQPSYCGYKDEEMSLAEHRRFLDNLTANILPLTS